MTAHVSTADAFAVWLQHARRGDAVVYHRGCIGADRQTSTQADELANAVYRQSDMDTPHISPCYHIRGWTHGTRKVDLVQLRATGGRSVYIARRK